MLCASAFAQKGKKDQTKMKQITSKEFTTF